jgi:hypothetical protein
MCDDHAEKVSRRVPMRPRRLVVCLLLNPKGIGARPVLVAPIRPPGGYFASRLTGTSLDISGPGVLRPRSTSCASSAVSSATTSG